MTKTKGTGAEAAKSSKEDAAIIGTNNSSIVSKRSVERLYYAHEPHFFRYFVKKPQRRAPLINRGYWLRMYAIDFVVRKFLQEECPGRKVVVNLGCGYDPLPWQCITRYGKACQNTLFVDIDYKDLMLKKREMVLTTPELRDKLTNITSTDSSGVLLTSDEYVQLGCDLSDLSALSLALTKVVDSDIDRILFTAEVSITYMNCGPADRLIQWTAKYKNGRFCLLEQLLPEGRGHPFAETMMAHFEKLGTPLGSVDKYPTTMAQEQRFLSMGWSNVVARNLWDLWSSPEFLTLEERLALNVIEPFDEWEELALFGCHYVLLLAENSSSSATLASLVKRRREQDIQCPQKDAVTHRTLTSTVCPKGVGLRKFGAPLHIRSHNRKHDLVGNFAGMSLNTRDSSCDLFTSCDSALYHAASPSQTPGSRMCHTITELYDVGSLLVGGRTSPDNALSDCWLYHKWLNLWERVDSLPQPRYRHAAVSTIDGAVLVFGGKTDSRTIASEVIMWTRRRGWIECICDGSSPPFYGSAVIITSQQGSTVNGVLVGGMTVDGRIQESLWTWTFSNGDDQISFREVLDGRVKQISRFGSSVLVQDNQIYIIGGIAVDALLRTDEEAVLIETSIVSEPAQSFRVTAIHLSIVGPRPLLVGVSSSSADGGMLVMGGGGVCFSFGSFWNKVCYTLHQQEQTPNDHAEHISKWIYLQTMESSSTRIQPNEDHAVKGAPQSALHIHNIPRVKSVTAEGFSSVVSKAKPVILEHLDIGRCTSKWSDSYLAEHVGVQRQVVVHKAKAKQMSFAQKNFEYVTQSFGDFMESIAHNEMLYLRSLAAQDPSETPAQLARDFPTIASDFQLPLELSLVRENAHSSPLRISGPVNMWLHYDVMSNVLCQIRGRKRLLLFPPSDVGCFDFAPGASSSNIDVFTCLSNQALRRTSPHEAILEPGDVLFIPALWLHTASPTDGVSVAVNVFFRNLNHGYAAGKDVYGNRDLQAYEKGRQDVAKIARSFDKLPDEMRSFYLQRLAQELSQKTASH